MLGLIKNDIMINSSGSESLNMLLYFMLPLLPLFIGGEDIDLLTFHIPVLMTIYKSIPMDHKSLSEKYNIFIQSLPIKRWEYVFSKYISTVINHLMIIIYILFILKLYSFLGFKHLDFISLNLLRESLFLSIATFAFLIPVTFILFNKGRIFIVIFSLSMIGQNYKYEEYGMFLNSIVQSIKNSPIIIIILLYFISIIISTWIYNRKDLT